MAGLVGARSHSQFLTAYGAACKPAFGFTRRRRRSTQPRVSRAAIAAGRHPGYRGNWHVQRRKALDSRAMPIGRGAEKPVPDSATPQ